MGGSGREGEDKYNLHPSPPEQVQSPFILIVGVVVVLLGSF